jgi:hypothetical protein
VERADVLLHPLRGTLGVARLDRLEYSSVLTAQLRAQHRTVLLRAHPVEQRARSDSQIAAVSSLTSRLPPGLGDRDVEGRVERAELLARGSASIAASSSRSPARSVGERRAAADAVLVRSSITRAPVRSSAGKELTARCTVSSRDSVRSMV